MSSVAASSHRGVALLRGLGSSNAVEEARAREAIRLRIFGRGQPIAIGRYELRECIGGGGMGLVFAAHDSALDRVVALKLLRVDRIDDVGDARRRVQAEAQALAGLNHPNVVTIYDVGSSGSTLWVAMELVHGSDLRTWLEHRRSATEIMNVFRGVAAGLAAAHEAGIVHRDVKPENILVGRDGRARVADFGLARLLTNVPSSQPDAALGSTGSTQPAGTPGYVAPEVVEGAPADDRSDVYAFCVTLYEALYGRLPDASGQRRAPHRTSTGERVPNHVIDVLARGLAPHESRIGSIAAVQRALGRRGGSRRRVAIVAAALAGVAVAADLGMTRLRSDSAAAVCEHEGDPIAEVWNDDARERLRAHILASNTALAQDAAPRALRLLDEYAAQWSEIRATVCHRAEVEHTMTSTIHVAARACLDERRSRMAALLDVAVEGDPVFASGIVAIISALPPLDACEDEARLVAGGWPDDPDESALMADLVEALARVPLLDSAARYQEALAVAQYVAARAHARGLATVAADAEGRAGWQLANLGRYDEAERALEDAFHLATREQADMLAARDSAALTHVVGVQLGRHEDGLAWGRHAQSAAARSGIDDPALHATVELNIANVLSAKGDDEGAMARRERALALYERALGPDHPQVARALNNLAGSAASLGRLDLAEAHASRALAIREVVLGPDHPDVGHVRSTLGRIADATGDHRQALAHMEKALEISIASVGTEHPETAKLMANIGMIEADLPGGGRSLERLEDALAILERTLGSEHPDTVHMLEFLASTMVRAGDADGAERLLLRGLRSCESTLGVDHLQCAHLTENLGFVAQTRGRYDDALAYHVRALAVREAASDPRQQPWVSTSLMAIGMTHLLRGAASEAIPVLERTLELRRASPRRVELLAEAQYQLALALWDGGGDRARALSLAHEAAAGYRDLGEGGVEQLRAVEAWLASR